MFYKHIPPTDKAWLEQLAEELDGKKTSRSRRRLIFRLMEVYLRGIRLGNVKTKNGDDKFIEFMTHIRESAVNSATRHAKDREK
jgi:hypothetical protein